MSRLVPSLLLGVYAIVVLSMGYVVASLIAAIFASSVFTAVRLLDKKREDDGLAGLRNGLGDARREISELRSAFAMLQDRVSKIEDGNIFGP